MIEGVTIRPVCSDDHPHILANWLNQYFNYSYFTKRIRKSIYFSHHEPIAKKIINSLELNGLIACHTDDPEVIFGFLIASRINNIDVIHFILVKEELRKNKIGSALIKASGIDMNSAQFTHWTFDMNDLIHKYPSLTYNPYNL